MIEKIVKALNSIDEMIELTKKKVSLLSEMRQAIIYEKLIKGHEPKNCSNIELKTMIRALEIKGNYALIHSTLTSYSSGLYLLNTGHKKYYIFDNKIIAVI